MAAAADPPAAVATDSRELVAGCGTARGIGHTSCLPAQRPSMGVMLNSYGESRDGLLKCLSAGKRRDVF